MQYRWQRFTYCPKSIVIVLPPSRIMSLRVSRRGMIPALLFIAAFIAASVPGPAVRLGSGFETLAIARNLAGHGQFPNPSSPHLKLGRSGQQCRELARASGFGSEDRI
jgi:hypothetical protein